MRRRSYRRRRNAEPDIDALLGETLTPDTDTQPGATPLPLPKPSPTMDDDDEEEFTEEEEEFTEEDTAEEFTEEEFIEEKFTPRRRCEVDSAFQEARERLKYQTEAFFSQTLSEKKKSEFEKYYPYLELKSRTLPIPSLVEYQTAIGIDTKTPIPIKEAYAQFEDTIILFLRKNGNTQIIFPGKSTTSYTMRGYGYKEQLWTPSVEYMTYSYESILEQASQDSTLGNNAVDFGKAMSFDLRSGTAKVGKRLSQFTVALNFCNSLEVAKNWLETIWINAKTSRMQKKYKYRCLFFQETKFPTKGTPSVSMKFLGQVKLFPKKSESKSKISGEVIEEVFPGIETKSNPQRRLPNKYKKDRKFRRRRRRHRL